MPAPNLLRFLHVGPGGISCRCCFPPRGKRKVEFRKARKRAKREAFRIEEIAR